MGVSPLADLIEQAQDDFLRETGVPLTQGDIHRRSGLSRQRISQLLNEKPKTLLPPDTIDKLAKGIRKSYEEVLEAALLASGYDVPSAPLAARKGIPRKRLGQDDHAE